VPLSPGGINLVLALAENEL